MHREVILVSDCPLEQIQIFEAAMVTFSVYNTSNKTDTSQLEITPSHSITTGMILQPIVTIIAVIRELFN